MQSPQRIPLDLLGDPTQSPFALLTQPLRLLRHAREGALTLAAQFLTHVTAPFLRDFGPLLTGLGQIADGSRRLIDHRAEPFQGCPSPSLVSDRFPLSCFSAATESSSITEISH